MKLGHVSTGNQNCVVVRKLWNSIGAIFFLDHWLTVMATNRQIYDTFCRTIVLWKHDLRVGLGFDSELRIWIGLKLGIRELPSSAHLTSSRSPLLGAGRRLPLTSHEQLKFVTFLLPIMRKCCKALARQCGAGKTRS